VGLIIKQTIKGSFWTYLGVIIGFVTVSYLFPRYLTADVIGLFGLLVSYSTLFAEFSSLGVNGVTSRLFPYFRNKQKSHNGFLFNVFLILIIGYLLFTVFFYFFSSYLKETNIEKSELFSDYVYLLLPVTFFVLIFTFLDNYSKILYDAVTGTILQEFVQRFIILTITVCYIFKIITLQQFIWGYAFAISVKAFIMFYFLYRKKEISLKPNFGFITQKLKKEMINVAAFSIIGGLGSTIVFNIDKILINQMIGLSNTGIYTIAFSFGVLVSLPSRSLLKISSTVIAEAWKKNDIDEIKIIYHKSCLNQFIIGGLLFIGIWANIDNIFDLIGNEYVAGKWVIFFVSLGFLFDMVTGVNGYIISLSKYFRISVVFVSILIVLVVITNLIFIPILGITGAAMASALSLFISNLMRYLYLLFKFKMQPYNNKFILILLALIIAYGIGLIIPRMDLIMDILIRSSIITIVFGILILVMKISPDVNHIFKLALSKLNK
jgi:O-antigen/teichoic acid export membrane protein